MRLDDLPDVITAAELGAFLRIGRAGTYKFLKSNGIRVGRRIFCSKVALTNFLSTGDSPSQPSPGVRHAS